jgi:hypothetical protein
MYNDLGHAMRYNDLVAMLHAAKAELSVLASYAEDPTTQWPSLGLRVLFADWLNTSQA